MVYLKDTKLSDDEMCIVFLDTVTAKQMFRVVNKPNNCSHDNLIDNIKHAYLNLNDINHRYQIKWVKLNGREYMVRHSTDTTGNLKIRLYPPQEGIVTDKIESYNSTLKKSVLGRIIDLFK